MIIDILKGAEIYKTLQAYNKDIIKVCEGYTFTSEEYDLKNKKLSWWFSPKCVRDLAISHVYPNCLPIQQNKILSLNLYAPNYFSLLLVNALYEDKNLLIEDQASGMSRFAFYLNKLGFNNFNMIDSFTQLPQDLFEKLMEIGNINYTLNNWECVPQVINLVGYTHFIKEINPETELVIIYNNTKIITKDENGNFQYLFLNLEKYTPLENKVCLAVDKYGLAKAYCNKDKLEEFQNKLKQYEE